MLISEFRELYLPRKPADTKVKTQSDLKTCYQLCLAEKGETEVSDIPEE